MSTAREKRYSPKERVALARSPKRPNVRVYIDRLFDNFFELRGDRLFGDDKAIVCGVAELDGIPVTVAGHVKGAALEENVACNFGMPNPEGYRKFKRIALQSEKFGRPLITFIDTPGAYPGKGAEERGQGEAIASCLYELSNLKIPIIAVVTGEGGSGGALALSVADKIVMLENAVYSVLSPEGFATILWKDAKRSGEACEVMKLTAYDLQRNGIADEIIKEPKGGIQESPTPVIKELEAYLKKELSRLMKTDVNTLLNTRYEKYRKIGRG